MLNYEIAYKELRTVHDQSNMEYLEMQVEITRLRAINAELVAALQDAVSVLERDGDEWNVCSNLRAAIAKSATYRSKL